MYRNEVLSYKLEWSPPHKSPKFWTENCFRFEEADNLLLRTLKGISLIFIFIAPSFFLTY